MSQETETKPAAQLAIDELAGEAASAEDQALVAEWQTELDAQRAEAIGRTGLKTSELVDLGDGSIVTKEQAREVVESGEAGDAIYKKGRRS